MTEKHIELNGPAFSVEAILHVLRENASRAPKPPGDRRPHPAPGGQTLKGNTVDEAIKILTHVRNLLLAVIILAGLAATYTKLSDGPSRPDCALERHEYLMGRGKVSPACQR